MEEASPKPCEFKGFGAIDVAEFTPPGDSHSRFEANRRRHVNSKGLGPLMSPNLCWELQDLSLSPVSGLGPKIADFGGPNGPLLPQSPLEKVGGFDPHPFPVGFAVGGAI